MSVLNPKREVWVIEIRDSPDSDEWRYWDNRRQEEKAAQFLGWNNTYDKYRVVRYVPETTTDCNPQIERIREAVRNLGDNFSEVDGGAAVIEALRRK